MLFNKKQKRMNKIINPKTGKGVLLAFDHGVEHGPAEYDGIDIDPLRIAKIAIGGNANALIVHPGSARYIRKFIKKLPLIIKLTARTNLAHHKLQSMTGTVTEAEALGAVGVACTIYVGSKQEHIMLENFCKIKEDCRKRKMPLVGFMYPRIKGKKSTKTKHVRYAARVGAELGLDVVKTYYTGSSESFSKVVKDANFVPVVAAGGGPKDNELEVLELVREIMKSGASGMAIGRNIWTRDKGMFVLDHVQKIVHGRN